MNSIKISIKTVITFIVAVIFFASCSKSPVDSTPTDNLDALLNSKTELSIFAAAIKKARLDIFTKGGGPFTIFAPTNDAFKAAGINSESDLNLIDSNLLVQILTYHIQAVARTYPEIPLGPNATMSTQGGFSQYASRYLGGSAYINGAQVTSADIRASNGILYTINKLLNPPFNSVLVNLSINTNYSLMYQAIIKAGVSSTYTPASTAPVTVLPISNSDMTAAGYDATTIAGLTGTGLATLTNILKYHVITQRIFSPDFKTGTIKTALVIGTTTSTLAITFNAGVTTIKGMNNTGTLNLTAFDVNSSNGVIQGVNGVLKP